MADAALDIHTAVAKYTLDELIVSGWSQIPLRVCESAAQTENGIYIGCDAKVPSEHTRELEIGRCDSDGKWHCRWSWDISRGVSSAFFFLLAMCELTLKNIVRQNVYMK